jgi:hypothetical protein
MIVFDPSQTATLHTGVHFDAVQSQLVRLESTFHESTQPIPKYLFSEAPPAVLLPSQLGEPLRFDACWPPHPRGSGRDWPTDARFSLTTGTGRFPLAFAWNLARQKEDWQWHRKDQSVSASPAEAIAAAVVELCGATEKERPVLVIPNFSDLSTQQRILELSHARHCRVRLLWRPVAAAFSWLHILPNDPECAILDRNESFSLLVFYLGLDHLEATPLRIVRDPTTGTWQPARERPSQDEFVGSPGINGMVNVGIASLRDDAEPSPENVWRLLWTTAFARDALSLLNDGDERIRNGRSWTQDASLEPDVVRRAWSNALRGGIAPVGRELQQRLAAFQPSTSDNVFLRWKDRIKKTLAEYQAEYAIICGPLATVPDKSGFPFGATLLNETAPSVRKFWVEGNSLPTGILAHGAAVYAARLATGMPTYLDKLPSLCLQVTLRGQAQWLDLLETEQWVSGGKPWTKEDYDFDLAVKEGSTELPLAVDHEEFDFVRLLKARLPKKTTRQEKVTLKVEVEPAQGNARIYVIPSNKEAFGRGQVLVNWGTMDEARDSAGSPLTAEQYLKTLPRAFPDHNPRRSSGTTWPSCRAKMQEYLAGQLFTPLDAVVRKLQQLDYQVENLEQRAVSSDSTVDFYSEVLDVFLGRVTRDFLATDARSAQFAPRLKALTYASADDPDFLKFLVSRLQRDRDGTDTSILIACGHCLRDPTHMAIFTHTLQRRLANRPTGTYWWFKALSDMLRYRENALRDVPSDACETLTQAALRVFLEERRLNRPSMRSMCMAMVITYLLRKRQYDDDFLRPDSVLACRVKEAFENAREALTGDRMPLSIAQARYQRLLQIMIEYIDRQGSGLIYVPES